MRSSQTYMRSQVLEAEQGVCQHCGLRAHDLFLKVRDAPPSQRKEMLEKTWLAQLSLKQVGSQSVSAITKVWDEKAASLHQYGILKVQSIRLERE